ncbi:MAG: hypothetical protein FJZ16_05195 [Candidatus Omnitrophica bacterium]|nr:hypothetical protein [Candidatus Omnitrophota bacterium]
MVTRFLLSSIVILNLSISTGICQNLESGNLDEAKKIYQEGLDFAQNGNCKLAITKFKKAIQLYPDLAEAHHDLAGCYRILGIEPKAIIEEMEKAILLAPNWTSYRRDLGLICIEQKDWKGAISQLNVLWDLDFEIAKELEGYIVQSRGMSLKEISKDGTTTMVDKTLKNKEDIAAFDLLMEGQKYLTDGLVDKATITLEKAVSLNP